MLGNPDVGCFGVLLPKYHEKPSHFDELVNFQIAVFGKGLVEAIPKS